MQDQNPRHLQLLSFGHDQPEIAGSNIELFLAIQEDYSRSAGLDAPLYSGMPYEA